MKPGALYLVTAAFVALCLLAQNKGAMCTQGSDLSAKDFEKTDDATTTKTLTVSETEASEDSIHSSSTEEPFSAFSLSLDGNSLGRNTVASENSVRRSSIEEPPVSSSSLLSLQGGDPLIINSAVPETGEPDGMPTSDTETSNEEAEVEVDVRSRDDALLGADPGVSSHEARSRTHRDVDPKDDGANSPYIDYDGRYLAPKTNGRQLGSDPSPVTVKFDPVPRGDDYKTNTAYAHSDILLSWIGGFVSLLQPSEFPLELAKMALEQRITGQELIMESMKVEPGLVACMVIGLTLAILVPASGLFVCCCRFCGKCGGQKIQKHGSCFNCRRRTLTASMATILFIIAIGLGLMAFSNERLKGAVAESRVSISNNVDDLNTYLKNTKLQLRFLITNSLEQVISAIHSDLDDIEFLLGRPLQRELATEAQIEVALDSLLHISGSIDSISSRMRVLQESIHQAASRSIEVNTLLADLQSDLDRFVTKCSEEDMDLCKTLDTTGMRIDIRFDSISFRPQLKILESLQAQNLTSTAQRARQEFDNIPKYVEQMTRNSREEVKRALRNYRSTLYHRVRRIDEISYDMEIKTRELKYQVDRVTARVQEVEPYRHYLGIALACTVGFVWTFLAIGFCCGCSFHRADVSATERSCISNTGGHMLLASVFFMFVFSALLWVIVVFLFVIGAHSQAFVCRPLYDEPEFRALTKLMDETNTGYEGGSVLSNILFRDDNVNIRINEVLNQCREGGAAYTVFKLNHFFHLEAEVDYRSALDLRKILNQLKVNLSDVEILSPAAEQHLLNFLESIRLDLRPYRQEVERPLTEKKLPAFAEQMQSVAGQLRSVTSSAELFKIVARTRNVIANTVYPLEKRKEDLTYQLATLDMEVMPLQRQINQSVGHLRTIQYFIHNHGSSLAASKARGYVERVMNYIKQYSDHVQGSAFRNVAPCTPVWNLFDSARGITCNRIIEPLNALWFSTGLCLVLFIPGIIVSLKLARYYVRMDYDNDDTLPLNDVNGSPPGSNSSLQGAVMWGPQQHHTHSHHNHHNGFAQQNQQYTTRYRRDHW
ncbi:prominin [Oratosquilla oratoria]|uniref:prominin n=1 Tax=Oratosquilla oratoria TaxID=337810 RepID=UPI003F762BCA